MDALQAYRGSDEEGDEEEEAGAIAMPTRVVSSAPDVDANTHLLVADAAKSGALVPVNIQGPGRMGELIDPRERTLEYNPTADQLFQPAVGPAHPYNMDGLSAGQKNHKLGYVEDVFVTNHSFQDQYYSFDRYGQAFDPAGNEIVSKEADKSETDFTSAFEDSKKRTHTDLEAGEDEDNPWAIKMNTKIRELTEEEKKLALENLKTGKGRRKAKEPEELPKETTKFHGKDEKDYFGRSWIEAPKDVKKDNENCYIPKRCIHTWQGHTKGVNAIRFFPGTGHLLLSASLDAKVKIWDVHNTGKTMRTYMGHLKGVRDIHFSNDGRKFLSASFDKNIQLWDTETGQIIKTFTTGRVPYVVKLHPDEDKQNVLLAGMSDKKIVQWDMNTGEIQQEYDEHLGAVNTITFCDENRRFITSSDDKTLRVWEFGIPVQIKYIADPSMHSMPSITMSPNQKWMICQSLDNTIITYSTRERFRINRKKVFKGHSNAGYACQVNFSPDCQYVLSGDSEGRVFFWDWKTTRIFRSLRAHRGVCIGCVWHPLETSKVATAGWDGLIKYWD